MKFLCVLLAIAAHSNYPVLVFIPNATHYFVCADQTVTFYKTKVKTFDELNIKLPVYTPAKSNFFLKPITFILLLILHQYLEQTVRATFQYNVIQPQATACKVTIDLNEHFPYKVSETENHKLRMV